jgi:hypothetical protein
VKHLIPISGTIALIITASIGLATDDEVFNSIEKFVAENAGEFKIINHGFIPGEQVYYFICQSTEKDKSQWSVYIPISLTENEDAVKALFIQAGLDYSVWFEREQKIVKRMHN